VTRHEWPPTARQIYEWRGIRYTITRVARDQTWADIRVRTDHGGWSKRQPLPLPHGSRLVELADRGDDA
jgi:hypothetical protein